MMRMSIPERWLKFEELLGSLSSFGDVVSEHANGEELAHVPVVIHFLQGTFASQQTVQPHTYNTRCRIFMTKIKCFSYTWLLLKHMRFAEAVGGVNKKTLKATDAFEVSWFVCWLVRFRIILPIFLSSMELSNCWPATIRRTARLMPE